MANNDYTTPRLNDLFLKSSGPFYEIRDDSNQQQSAMTAGALVDQLIRQQKLDTGSGIAESMSNDPSTVFGEDCRLLMDSASNIIDGTLDSALLPANFGDQTTSKVFEEIRTFARKLDLTDPFERYGRNTIIDLTDTLNRYFFGNQTNENISGNNSSDTGNTSNQTLPSDTGNIDLSQYPSLEERTNANAPRFSYSEIADFLSDSEIDPDSLFDELTNPAASLPNSSTLTDLASSLDNYFNDNIGNTLSQGLCGSIAEIYETVITILELIPIFVTHINMVRDIFSLLTDLDFVKLAIQVAQQLVYQAIKEKILEVIDLIYKTVKSKILAIVNSAKAVVAALQGKKSTPYKTLEDAYLDAKDFFSDLSLDSFKEKIENFVDDLGKQFERFTVENIGQLIYRLCKFIEGLQALLFGSVNDFQQITINTAAELQMMQSVSLINTKRAVEYGGKRLSLSVRKQFQTQAREAVNAVSASFDDLIAGESTDYITAPEMTAEEAETLFGLDGPVAGKFKFSGTADQPYKNGTDIKNFMRTKPIVFARLMRMANRTGYEYDVKEAFLLKEDNENRGARDNTIASSGSSIKVRIEGDFNWVAKTIISASQEGFVGIGVGSDYVHLDIGPRELTWVDGYTAGFTDANALSSRPDANKYLELLERHKRKEFTKKVL